MFSFILQMVLTVAVSSIKNPGNVNPTEWSIIEEVYVALGSLLAKKPTTIA